MDNDSPSRNWFENIQSLPFEKMFGKIEPQNRYKVIGDWAFQKERNDYFHNIWLRNSGLLDPPAIKISEEAWNNLEKSYLTYRGVPQDEIDNFKRKIYQPIETRREAPYNRLDIFVYVLGLWFDVTLKFPNHTSSFIVVLNFHHKEWYEHSFEAMMGYKPIYEHSSDRDFISNKIRWSTKSMSNYDVTIMDKDDFEG